MNEMVIYKAKAACRIGGSYRQAGDVFTMPRFDNKPAYLEEVGPASNTIQLPGDTPGDGWGKESTPQSGGFQPPAVSLEEVLHTYIEVPAEDEPPAEEMPPKEEVPPGQPLRLPGAEAAQAGNKPPTRKGPKATPPGVMPGDLPGVVRD